MPNETRTTIGLVDDDASVRTALRRLLISNGYEVETFESGADLLGRGDLGEFGCLVLDDWMPGMSGTELFDRITRAGVTVPVVFLTAHDDVPTGVGAIKRGAVDFLVKPADEPTLLRAIRTSVARHAEIRSRERDRNLIRDRLATLSPREREVMLHVVQGRLNKVIAAELGISEKTVKVHRHRVMEKTGAGSVAELVRLADACAELHAEDS